MVAVSFAIISLLSSAFLGYVFVQFHREITHLRATRSTPHPPAIEIALRSTLPAAESLSSAAGLGAAPQSPQPVS
jgi:hypothetical protein